MILLFDVLVYMDMLIQPFGLNIAFPYKPISKR